MTIPQMDTFLTPIEKPQGLTMKLVYAMTRRQFGKVLTPLKVFSARLPLAFALFTSKISKLDKKLLLAPETALLVREQVARINVWLVASEHFYNMTNIGLNIHSDMLCDISRMKK